LKHTGEFPIRVNTFLSSKDHSVIPAEVIRATEEEKQFKFTLENLHKANAKQVQLRLEKIQDALENEFI
jgi:methylmalonyl-CoA mutase